MEPTQPTTEPTEPTEPISKGGWIVVGVGGALVLLGVWAYLWLRGTGEEKKRDDEKVFVMEDAGKNAQEEAELNEEFMAALLKGRFAVGKNAQEEAKLIDEFMVWLKGIP